MLKRTLKVIGALILLIVILLAATPFLFKNRINAKLKAEINEKLNAKADYGGFSISFIRSFPNIRVALSGLSVIGINEFKGDTLVLIKIVSFTIDLRDFIKGSDYKLLSLDIVEPNVRAKIDYDGKSNWNILKPVVDNGGGGNGGGKAFSLRIKEYRIERAEITYDDKIRNAFAGIRGFNCRGSGDVDVTSDLYDFDAKTSISELHYKIPGLETSWSMLNLSLKFKAKKSDVDRKNYGAMQLSGNVKVADLVYQSNEPPMPVCVSDIQITFSPGKVTLNNFSALFGKSDIQAKGTLDNFIPYLFGKGDLTGLLEVRSNVFNVNDWLQKGSSNVATPSAAVKTAGNSPSHYFKVPPHINLTANSQFSEIHYNKLTLTNVRGRMVIKDEVVNATGFSASLLCGNANFFAKYDTKKAGRQDFIFNSEVRNLDMQQTFNSSELPVKIAPVMKYMQGNFSGNVKGSGQLRPGMNVDYNSLQGGGKVEIPDAKIISLPALDEVAKLVKVSSLQNLEMKNTSVAFKFNNGRMNLAPTDIKFRNGYTMHLEGSNGFDQTLNYNIRIDAPAKDLAAASGAQNILSQIPGLSALLPPTIGFQFKITGTVAKPEVKLLKVIPGGNSSSQ